MKKAITLAGCTFLLITAWTQNKTSFGFRGGYNVYTIHGRYADGSNFWLKTENGFNLGADFEFPIARNFYLQPGLVYNQKGASFENYLYMSRVFKGDVKLSYIEVPVNIVYKPSVGGGHILLGAGPYLGRGTGREAGVKEGEFEVRFTEDVSTAELQQTPFYYRPWDAGANFLAGYQLSNNLFAQFNGQIGMKKINPSVNGQWEGKKNKHRNLGVGFSVGYRF